MRPAHQPRPHAVRRLVADAVRWPPVTGACGFGYWGVGDVGPGTGEGGEGGGNVHQMRAQRAGRAGS